MEHPESAYGKKFCGGTFVAVKIFSFRKGNSVVHGLPPLLKIFALILFSIFVFSGKGIFTPEKIFSFTTILKISAEGIFVLIFFFLSEGNFRTILALRGIFALGIFVTVFRTISFSAEENFIKIFPHFFLNPRGFFSGALYTINFFLASFFAQIVFETTSPMQIEFSLEDFQCRAEKIFPPLKKFNAALLLSLAINFIPEVFDAWEKIRAASRSRLGEKSRSPVLRTKNLCANFLSLFSLLLRKAETKRTAMLNRGKR
jgi:biotin transport system permease protein